MSLRREMSRTLVVADDTANPCFFLQGWEPVLAIPAWALCTERAAA